MNEADTLAQKQFDSLPLDVKESISRVPWRERIQDIAKREGLDAEKSSALEAETMLILYGFENPDDYTQNIVTQVGLEESAAERITQEVGDQIIEDIEKQFEMIDAISHKDKIVAPQITHAPTTATPVQASAPAPVAPVQPSAVSSVPEIAPNMLPEVLPTEKAHDVPRVTITPITAPYSAVVAPVVAKPVVEGPKPRPNLQFAPSAYTKGKDPYREPLE